MIFSVLLKQQMPLFPVKKRVFFKDFWSTELSDLKKKSTDAFSLWKSAGSPSSGSFHVEKVNTHMQYEHALRLAKRERDSFVSDEFCQNLLSGDSVKFWKNWNNLESRQCDVTCVNCYFKQKCFCKSVQWRLSLHFVLQETVNHSTKHGSNAIVSFLDCSKAFDKVSHKGLFIKLMERNVPIAFLNIFIYWFSNGPNGKCKPQIRMNTETNEE